MKGQRDPPSSTTSAQCGPRQQDPDLRPTTPHQHACKKPHGKARGEGRGGGPRGGSLEEGGSPRVVLCCVFILIFSMETDGHGGASSFRLAAYFSQKEKNPATNKGEGRGG